MKRKSIYERIKETPLVASRLVVAAPVKLPPKVVAVAKYVALVLNVLEAVENTAKGEGERDESE